MLVAVFEVVLDQLFDVVGLEQVVLEGGGEVHEGHAGFDAVLEIDVVVEVVGRPEVDELNGVVAALEAVDAPEALDDADGVPVDVVVDEVVAVLKVLAFADAVGGDEQVDLAVSAASRASSRGFSRWAKSW